MFFFFCWPARVPGSQHQVREPGRTGKIEKQRNNFFPQHIVEGLLNSRRRVSDRPGWILISKTPARKSTNVIVVVFFILPKRNKGCKEEILTEMPYSLLYCKLRPLGSALQLSEASRLRTRMRQSPK